MKLTYFAILTAMSSLAIGCAEETITRSYTFDEPVTRVVADIDSADITVLPAAGPQTYVDLDLDYWTEDPDYRVWLDGSTLRISMDCHWDCDGGYVVRVPADATASIDIGSGDIGIRGLDGDLELWADSGDVDLDDVTGAIRVDTGSGDITGSALLSPAVLARAGSGDIDLQFDVRAESIDLETGSGDIDLAIPAGAYDLTVRSGSGDERVRDVFDDPASRDTVRVTSGSGDVSVEGF